ncbi:hypothetical protein HZC53_01875 [Candidatus Uhrbacteria bacterium]|nr:hypothetical protein [Candidatus Uhrbacteria bacterium]
MGKWSAKKEVAIEMLQRSDVFIHLDPRQSGVVVPPQYRRGPHLILEIGLNMRVPIPDLKIGKKGIKCTLSFNRTPFFCIIPWKSVYALVDQNSRGMIWHEDMPPEMAVRKPSNNLLN